MCSSMDEERRRKAAVTGTGIDRLRSPEPATRLFLPAGLTMALLRQNWRDLQRARL